MKRGAEVQIPPACALSLRFSSLGLQIPVPRTKDSSWQRASKADGVGIYMLFFLSREPDKPKVVVKSPFPLPTDVSLTVCQLIIRPAVLCWTAACHSDLVVCESNDWVKFGGWRWRTSGATAACGWRKRQNTATSLRTATILSTETTSTTSD